MEGEKTNMAPRSFTRYVEQELGKFPHFVVCAVLEWVLIFILFLDGFLAFLANEFANFFELKTPCLLCTRIDHVLVHRDPDFYFNESICEGHKKNVSSLALCHNHKKLSDIRQMCESCLLSFATERESDCDTYKSLVGILHKDLECFVEDDQPIQLSLRDDGMQVGSSSSQRCSCCGEPLKAKSSYPKGKNLGNISQAPAPAPSPRSYPYSTSRNEESRGLELPHIQYTELKFMADNESEVHEDEDGSNVNNPTMKLREDDKAASVPLLKETHDIHDEFNKTPTFMKGNRFFGIPLTDSGNSPRWSYRINRKSPLEKSEFASDSNEGNIPIEGEDAILNHLNRQVRLDRKSLMALYMELDEERSASAVAANNAMAMITRLQAEKAAVQMEALQYQRMMEEQAEYDEEALQATRDMLMKREEEIKGLETELDIYREKYGGLTEDDFKEINGNNSPHKIYEGEEYNGEESPNGHHVGGGKHSELFRYLKGEKPNHLGRMKKLEIRSPRAENNTHFSQSSYDSDYNVDSEPGKDSEVSLSELSSLTEIVKSLEAGSGFLEIVTREHEKHVEGSKILIEISQNLEKLRHLVMTTSETDSSSSPSSARQ